VIASVSRRYAKALLSLGLETGEHEKLAESVEAVVRVIAASNEARTLAQNPGYTQAQRQKLVDLLAQRLGLSATLVSFLRLLVDRQRLGELPDIARSYRDLVDAQVGRVRGTVTSASPLPPEELERVRKALAETTRKSLVLEARTDPEILGGVVAQVGPTVWDGSLRTQLERLRKELKDAPLQ
jgi:F-type H+-transporting ATPase subunit delta